MKQIFTRRFLLRSLIVVLWIAAGIFIFVNFRGHTLLVDNHNTETLRAPDMIKIAVDNGKGLEFFRGDRDRFPVAGAKHRIKVEFSDGSQPVEKQITLPLAEDMYLLSIPKMIAGEEPFIEPFHVSVERQPNEEEIIINDTELLLGDI
jgi:hypothetical protein